MYLKKRLLTYIHNVSVIHTSIHTYIHTYIPTYIHTYTIHFQKRDIYFSCGI